jgi:hypothetical protein
MLARVTLRTLAQLRDLVLAEERGQADRNENTPHLDTEFGDVAGRQLNRPVLSTHCSGEVLERWRGRYAYLGGILFRASPAAILFRRSRSCFMSSGLRSGLLCRAATHVNQRTLLSFTCPKSRPTASARRPGDTPAHWRTRGAPLATPQGRDACDRDTVAEAGRDRPTRPACDSYGCQIS